MTPDPDASLALSVPDAARARLVRVLGGAASGERLARMRASALWRDTGFQNPTPVSVMKAAESFDAMMAWWRTRADAGPRTALPMAEDPLRALAQPARTGLRVTWLGHSTTLLDVDGARFLTDPVFGPRASPSALVGPKRFHPPPLALDALPDVDAVLVSHDHYDHLDYPTIRALAARGFRFITSLGVGAHLEAWGVPAAKIIELDWWEETRVRDVRIVATPAQHFSGRGVGDRNTTLWSSFSLLGPVHRVFFSGDTGFTEMFSDIAKRFGPFDLAMLEVGAYHPSWGTIHLGPDNAARAFGLLDARAFLPIHWSTFALGPHAWAEPAETLWRLAEAGNLPLLTPLLGEPLEPKESPAPRAWWRHLTDPAQTRASRLGTR